MRVTVLYFAIARERAGGLRSEEFELADGATTTVLAKAVSERHPGLAAFFDRFRLAVNEEFVGDDTALQEGDEVAVIPPVAGG